MRGHYTQIFIHMVWATWDRLPLIDEQLSDQINQVIWSKCKAMKCEPLAIGGVEDHMHLLVRMQPAVTVAELVKAVKGSSSHLISNNIKPDEFFKWQGGYGAFSLAKDETARVIAYILNQRDHHKSGDLWVEYEKTTENGS